MEILLESLKAEWVKLLEAGFTVSSNVSTNLVLDGIKPLEVSLAK